MSMKRICSIVIAGTVLCMALAIGSCGFQGEEKAFVTRKNGFEAPLTRCSHDIFIWWGETEECSSFIEDAWFDYKEASLQRDLQDYFTHRNKFRGSMLSVNGGSSSELEIQILGGTAPDLIFMDSVYLVGLGKKGQVQDLHSRLAPETTEAFLPEILELYQDGPALYGLPFLASVTAMGGAAQQAKRDADEMGAQDYKAPSEISIPVWYEQEFETPANASFLYERKGQLFLSCLWNLGGEFLEAEETTAAFHQGEMGKAALEMAVRGLQGKNMGEGLSGNKSKLPYQKSSIGIGVTSTATKPFHCYRFAAYLSTQKHLQKEKSYSALYAELRQYPGSMPLLKQDVSEEGRRYYREALQQAHSLPKVSAAEDIMDTLDRMVQKVMDGGISQEEALQEAAKKVNFFLAQDREEPLP